MLLATEITACWWLILNVFLVDGSIAHTARSISLKEAIGFARCLLQKCGDLVRQHRHDSLRGETMNRGARQAN
jgi:hypothetical protein